MNNKIIYVVWRDASYGQSEVDVQDTGLVELHEVGFLLKEDDDCVVISMEEQDNATSTRNWVAVPKSCITRRYDGELPEILQSMRINKPKRQTVKRR